jgi:hypothetical protein
LTSPSSGRIFSPQAYNYTVCLLQYLTETGYQPSNPAVSVSESSTTGEYLSCPTPCITSLLEVIYPPFDVTYIMYTERFVPPRANVGSSPCLCTFLLFTSFCFANTILQRISAWLACIWGRSGHFLGLHTIGVSSRLVSLCLGRVALFLCSEWLAWLS